MLPSARTDLGGHTLKDKTKIFGTEEAFCVAIGQSCTKFGHDRCSILQWEHNQFVRGVANRSNETQLTDRGSSGRRGGSASDRGKKTGETGV